MTRDLQKSLEFAGIELELPGDAGLLQVPARVELSRNSERLIWTNYDGDKWAKAVWGKPEVLLRFTELADAPPETIRKFALTWGVLKLCKHGMPAPHSHGPYGGDFFASIENEFDHVHQKVPYCRPLGTTFFNDHEGYDKVEDWWFYARHTKALVTVITKLQQGELGSKEDWNAILERVTYKGRYSDHDEVWQRSDCVAVVNSWIRIAGLRPEIEFNPFNREFKDKRPRDQGHPPPDYYYSIRFQADRYSGSPLFSYLGCQLMTILVGHGFALCSGCAKIYSPPFRRPKRGQNNYCPACGRTVAVREAQRRFRSREKSLAKLQGRTGVRRQKSSTKKGK